MDAICVLFLLSSQLRMSFVSVVFDFSALLNGFAPMNPMLFTIDLIKIGKSGLLMDVIRVLFLFVFTTQIEFYECCV